MANEFKHVAVGTELTQAEYEGTSSHVFNDQAAGDIVYASSTSQLSRLGIGTAGKVLHVNSGASAPEWTAALTGVTSIYATDLILGEDSQTAIDFGTVNEIDFKVDNANRLTLTTGALYPETNNQIDLGTASLEFKDAYFDGTVTADAFAGPLTGTASTATVATTVTITDNESTNEDNAIIFTAGGDVDGGNIGLESDGTLTYNPSTGKITATGFIGALTGNADTATALATARAINGVNFDGSGAITVTAAGSTLSDTVTVAKGGTGATSLSAATTVDLDCTGAMALNSSGGTIGIGNDNVDQTINFATAGTRTLNIGINDGTDLTTIAVSGPVTIDRNTAGVSAENGKGLYVDFDRTVAGSGTAAHNDIGIDVDVNSRSLGTSSVIGIDIDVVGHGDGTSTATGLTVDVGSADTNYAALFNGGNVGIGVSDPAALLEIKTSTINIGGIIANNSNDDSIHLFNYQRTNAGTIFGLTRHGAMGIYGAPNAKMLIGTVTGMPLIFATNDLERMRMVAGGSVGIGTTAPVSKFELHADEGVNATISASHDTATERPLIDFLKRII